MKTRHMAFVLSACLAASARAEPDTNSVIRVEADRFIASSRPGAQLLREVPGVSLREQGEGGAQSDLSIRGSSFNTTGLLLNGLPLRNAQTEHWHANLPAPDAWFEAPRVLTGLDRFRRSSGHPSGSVELRLAPLLDDVHSLTLGGGGDELFFGNALFTETFPLEHGGSAGVSGFASFDSDRQTDGYAGNDLLRFNGGARVGAVGETMEGDLLATAGWRSFGARGFYGTSPGYPAEEEVTDYLAAGSLRFTENAENPAELTAVWQRTHDLYWLDKHNHAFYENEHTTDLVSLHGGGRYDFAEWLFADLRAEGELETMDSSSLGDHTREHGSFAVLPGVRFGEFELEAGGSWDLFSAFSGEFLPACGISWEFLPGQVLAANYTESARQPSFTELNYESPGSLGNSGLSLQKSRSAEVLWKGEKGAGRWRIGAFFERGKNIVDWIKTSPSARWTSVNLDPIETWGGTAEGWRRFSSGTEFGADAQLLSKDCSTAKYSSRYALDYPDVSGGIGFRQDLNKAFSLLGDGFPEKGGRFNKGLALRMRLGAARYVSNPVRRHGDTQFTSEAEVQWKPSSSLAFNAGVVNLLDNDFQTYPGQDVYGVRWYLSVSYTW